MNTCEFCKKDFTSSFTLKYHKNTAKYCLAIQKQNSSYKEEISQHACTYCKKEFSRKSSCSRHETTCGSKFKQFEEKEIELNNMIKEKDNQIIAIKHEYLEKEKELYKETVSLLKRTKGRSETNNVNINVDNTTNNTQNIINMKIDQLPLMNDFIPSVLTHPNLDEKLSTLTTKETFSKFIGTILNNHILLTDKSRAKAVYRELNQDGQIERKKNNIPQIITSQISKNNLLQEYIESTFAKVFEETDFSDEDSATYAANLGFLKNSITKITQEKIPDKRFVEPIVEHIQFIGKILKDTSTVEPIQQLENTVQE